ncbi:MAG: cytochrome C [Burkholderiales bacterium]|nr:cytochrome C [Burkholderiales bacterium]
MRRLALMALALVVLPHVAVQAQEVEAGRALAATCTGCHGTAGASIGPIPGIDGMEASRMILLLGEFRDGKREATIMDQLVRGYSDAQIQALAQWFESRKR